MSARRAGAALLLLLAPCAARAQRVEGAVTATRVTYRFTDITGPGELDGSYLGARVALEAAAVRLSVRGAFGQLTDPTGGLPARDVRITGLALGAIVLPWLEIGLDAQARRTASSQDTTVVRLAGGYARATLPFGSGLLGTADLSYYPAADVINVDPVNVALEAGVGVTWTPVRSPLTFSAGYRLFRLDYAWSGGFRPQLEQDQKLIVQLALHAVR